MKGGKKEEQASRGPLALTGNPGLRASEGRWLFQSFPIIEADPHVAPRKAAQTGTDSHSSCHFLSRQPALTPTLHFAFKDTLVFTFIPSTQSSGYTPSIFPRQAALQAAGSTPVPFFLTLVFSLLSSFAYTPNNSILLGQDIIYFIIMTSIA